MGLCALWAPAGRVLYVWVAEVAEVASVALEAVSLARAPDLVEYVVGFRAWCIGRDPNRSGIASSRMGVGGVVNDDLWSIGNHPVRWTQKMTAECLRNEYGWQGASIGGCVHDESETPHINCGCGLYARHQLGWPCGIYEGGCVGAVRAWGKIQVHGKTFRSARAEVVALGFSSSWHKASIKRIKRIADRLGALAVRFPELHDVALEFGEPVPESLRP